jgi:nucleotide-binding universal stress UspA family protein
MEPTAPDTPLLICYDGSPEAADAIANVASLLPGARAVVLTVWKPLVEELLAGPPDSPPIADPVDANERQREAALVFASEGERRATAAGLHAKARVVKATGSLWETIEETADELDARLIVCGTSRSGVKTALPGNLASTLAQRSSRPVLVVPSVKAAAERRRAITKDRGVRIKR